MTLSPEMFPGLGIDSFTKEFLYKILFHYLTWARCWTVVVPRELEAKLFIDQSYLPLFEWASKFIRFLALVIPTVSVLHPGL